MPKPAIKPPSPLTRQILSVGAVALAFVAGLMLAFLAATARPSCKQVADANGNPVQWGHPVPALWGRP